MADATDILELKKSSAPKITKESIMMKKKKSSSKQQDKPPRRPRGMNRELFALFDKENEQSQPLYLSDTSFKETIAEQRLWNTHKWERIPFANPARNDNAEFKHWERIPWVKDEPEEYYYSKFNTKTDVIEYSDAEYKKHLMAEDWTREETEHLMDLARRFDLRFVIMADRYDVAKFKKRSVVDLKERYYHMAGILAKLRNKTVITYNAEQDRKRKACLEKIYSRTTDQIEDEQYLTEELEKMDLGKTEGDKKIPKTKISTRPSKVDKEVNLKQLLESSAATGIKFPLYKNSGITLASQRLKLPASIGQTKKKYIEQQLEVMEIDFSPIPTTEVSQTFNDFRSSLVNVMELNSALSTREFELQSLRQQYERGVLGRPLTFPPQLSPRGYGVSESIQSSFGEDKDVVGGSSQPVLNHYSSLC